MTTSSKDPVKVVRDLVELLKNYAKQETIEPLKGLGRYIGFGIAGSLVFFLSLLFATLGILRVLQTEVSAFDGGWSWVPYLISIVFLLVFIVLSVLAISRERK